MGQQAVQQAQQRGLARAVGTDQHQAIAAHQRERNGLQRDAVAESHAGLLQADQRLGGRGVRRQGRWQGGGRGGRGADGPPAPPLQQHDRAIDRADDAQQHQAQAQRQREIALAGLQRDGRGHHPRDAGDIAADDHHRAHLGYRATEGGEQHGGYAQALVQQHQQRAGQRAGAERAQLVAALVQRRLHQPAGERGDQRRDQHSLRHHHRRGREQQAHGPERPGAREQQVDQQAHHHGGQGQ